MFLPRRPVQSKTHHPARVYGIPSRRTVTGFSEEDVDVVLGESSRWMGSRDAELSCAVVFK